MLRVICLISLICFLIFFSQKSGFAGAYSLAGLGENRFFNRLELVSRYDRITNAGGVTGLEQGSIPKGTSEQRIAVGFVFRPLGQLQFKVEYLHRNNKDAGDDQGLALQSVANW